MPSQVITLPKWIIAIRGVQALLAVVILGLSAYGLYWVAFNAWGFALFTCLATLFVVAYNILTAHVAKVKPAYNYWAILAGDAVSIIFWLASLASLAALRGTFKYDVTINGCYNNGTIGGGVCYKKRDSAIAKRAVATHGYLNMMSAAAGLSAINMLLFIATFVIFGINLKRQRKPASGSPVTNDKLEAHPMSPQTYEQLQQPYPQQYPQPTGSPAPQQYQQQYQPQYPPPTGSPPPQEYQPQYPQPTGTPSPMDYPQQYPQQTQQYAQPGQQYHEVPGTK